MTELADNPAVTAAPAADGAVATAGVPARSSPRTWGVLASIAWVAAAFEGFGRAVEYLFESMPLHGALWNAAQLLTGWAVELLVIVVAVRLTRRPVAEYLGWLRPRAKDVAFGVAVVVVFSLAQNGLAYIATGHAFDVEGYRAAVAAGTSPWWYVLKWWPAIICAPIVEESAVRGFMWRGIEDHAGRVAALVLTSLYFAAMHYNYFIDVGQSEVHLGTFGIYVVIGFMYGWLRWRGGSTTVTMIPHSVGNLWINLSPVIASALLP